MFKLEQNNPLWFNEKLENKISPTIANLGQLKDAKPGVSVRDSPAAEEGKRPFFEVSISTLNIVEVVFYF